MVIERWLHRLLDLKSVAKQTFTGCRVELTIDEPGDYGYPMITLTIYTKEDVEPSHEKLDLVRDWWITIPFNSEPFVLITLSFDDFDPIQKELVVNEELKKAKELLMRHSDLLENGEKDVTYDEYGPHHFLKLEKNEERYNLIKDTNDFLNQDEYK